MRERKSTLTNEHFGRVLKHDGPESCSAELSGGLSISKEDGVVIE